MLPRLASRNVSVRWMKGIFMACMTCVCVASNTPTTNLEGVLKFPDMSSFNLTARIALNHDEYTTFSRNDGSFILYNVGPGIHQLDIHNTAFHFPQIKVQLLEESMSTPKCLEYAYPGATKNAVPYPLVLTAYATFDYFEQRRGFSILVILKNPMFLMMGFSVVMMFMMPKIMENLEPEEKERMMQQMEMQKDPTKMLSSFFGGGEEQASTKGKKKSLKNQ